MRAEFYIQHETSPWSVIVFSYDFERSFFGEADLYWDESSIGDCALRALTFFGRHAWYWDDTKSGYRFAVEDGYLTSDGRDQIDRLVQHSLPMVDYSL